MRNYDILKTLCRKAFIVGSGDYWYEEGVVGNGKSVYYMLFHVLLYSLYGIMGTLEILAALFGVFPKDEKRQAITLAVSHTIVVLKIFVVALNKKAVRILNKNMIQTCENEEPALVAEKYKIIKLNFIAYCISVYVAVLCFVFEGFKRFLEGTHFVTIITYYPKFEDDSVFGTSQRIFWTLVLFCMMNNMVLSVDGQTVIHLVMYKYKFINLRNYLERVNDDFLKLNKTDPSSAAERLSAGLVEAIIMHNDLISLSEDIDNAFGTIIALQLLLSSGTAVALLLEIALSEQLTLVAGMKMTFFVAALFMLLGLFLCNAGEITYQAGLISNALYDCSWHECANLPPPHRSSRKLVLMASAQAQQPLVMKAFKMVELSYGTFLQVVRGTYSVFALFYAQNK